MLDSENHTFYDGDRVVLTCTGTVVATTKSQAVVEWDVGYTNGHSF